jgi:hypothetical protein
MLTSAELCHAVAAGQWMVGSTSAFVVTVAGLMRVDAEWKEELIYAVAWD